MVGDGLGWPPGEQFGGSGVTCTTDLSVCPEVAVLVCLPQMLPFPLVREVLASLGNGECPIFQACPSKLKSSFPEMHLARHNPDMTSG